jgi:TPR repeat protein
MDREKAIDYLEKAAQQGHEEAAQLLEKLKNDDAGQTAPISESEALYQKGMEAYQNSNLTDALALLEQAAQGGHALAQYQCAIMYSYSSHPDLEKALYWAREAADQGVGEAAVMVAELELGG